MSLFFDKTVDICLTAFLDTVADILSEGDSDVLKGYMNIYPKLLTLSIPFTLIKEEFYEAHKSFLQAFMCYLIKTEYSGYLYCFTITQTFIMVRNNWRLALCELALC